MLFTGAPGVPVAAGPVNGGLIMGWPIITDWGIMGAPAAGGWVKKDK